MTDFPNTPALNWIAKRLWKYTWKHFMFSTRPSKEEINGKFLVQMRGFWLITLVNMDSSFQTWTSLDSKMVYLHNAIKRYLIYIFLNYSYLDFSINYKYIANWVLVLNSAVELDKRLWNFRTHLKGGQVFFYNFYITLKL